MATLAAASVATQIAVGTTALAAVTSGAQYFEQKKTNRRSARIEEQAADTSKASAQVQNARRRRQAIAQARVAQARNTAGQSEATQASSGLQGVQSSLTTGLGANVSAQRQQVNTGISLQQFSNQRNQVLRQGQERIAGLEAVNKIGQTAASAYNPQSGAVDTYQGNPVARLGSFGSAPRPGQF